MRKWKKIICMLLVATITVMCVGCGNGNDSSGNKTADGKTKVTFAYWNSEDTMKPLLKLLKEKLPHIEVEYNFVENSSYGTAVQTKLTAGSGDDIIAFSSLNIMTLCDQGLLADLTERYGEMYESAGTDPYTFNDKLYAVPLLDWYEGIFYNKTIFKENSIEVPTTFDEFIQVCKTLESKGIKPLAMGAKDGATLLKSCLGYVQAEYLLKDEGAGFDAKFAKGETTLSGNWDSYIKEWSKLIDENIITQDMLGIDANQALDEFAMGQAAMWASGPWSYETIKQKNINMDFGMFPYLGSTKENCCLVGSPGAGITVNAKSKVLDEAYEVMDVICSPEGQKALMEGNPGSSSYFKGVESELPAEYDGIKHVLDEGKVMCSWQNWGYATNCFSDFTQNLQGLVAKRTTIKDMLAEVDRVAASYVRGE